MTEILRKNVAGQTFNVQLYARADGTDVTTGSPTVQVKKDGGAYANIAGSISHDADGSWEIAPTATDTNFDRGSFKITLTDALTVTMNAVTDPFIKLQDDGITSAKIAAGAIGASEAPNLDAAVSSRSTLTTAQVNAEVDTALADIDLDHLLSAVYDAGSPPGAAGSLLNTLVQDNGGGAAQFTENALSLAPSSGGGGGGMVEGQWRWSTGTSATDPGSGRISGNSGTFSAITEVYINQVTQNSRNMAGIIESLRPGDRLVIFQDGQGGNYIFFDLDAAPIDNGVWYTITGTVDETAGSWSNNTLLDVNFVFAEDALSQQQIRDAMKLDASAGAPAAGSIDEHLDSLDVTKLTTARASNLDNLDVAVGSRQPEGAVAVSGGTVNTVTNPVTVGTNQDKDGYSLSAAGNEAIHDAGDIDGRSMEEALRLIAATVAGVLSGANTSTQTYKGINGSTKDRIVATTNPGGRISIVEDVSA